MEILRSHYHIHMLYYIIKSTYTSQKLPRYIHLQSRWNKEGSGATPQYYGRDIEAKLSTSKSHVRFLVPADFNFFLLQYFGGLRSRELGQAPILLVFLFLDRRYHLTQVVCASRKYFFHIGRNWEMNVD